jgi:hypothetical protein
MGRRLSAILLGLLSAFVLAGPVLADTTPGPGNFRDSGSSDYFSAFATECGQSTCTDTYVYGANVDLQGGESFSYLCVDQFTYPLRGGGRFRSLSGCADTNVNIASDLTSATASATILADACGRRTCSSEEVTVSVSLTGSGDGNAYSYTQKDQFENCTDTYRVRGERAPAEGTIVLNGTEMSAFGEIGSETFAFSSRCR